MVMRREGVADAAAIVPECSLEALAAVVSPAAVAAVGAVSDTCGVRPQPAKPAARRSCARR